LYNCNIAPYLIVLLCNNNNNRCINMYSYVCMYVCMYVRNELAGGLFTPESHQAHLPAQWTSESHSQTLRVPVPCLEQANDSSLSVSERVQIKDTINVARLRQWIEKFTRPKKCLWLSIIFENYSNLSSNPAKEMFM